MSMNPFELNWIESNRRIAAKIVQRTSDVLIDGCDAERMETVLCDNRAGQGSVGAVILLCSAVLCFDLCRTAVAEGTKQAKQKAGHEPPYPCFAMAFQSVGWSVGWCTAIRICCSKKMEWDKARRGTAHLLLPIISFVRTLLLFQQHTQRKSKNARNASGWLVSW